MDPTIPVISRALSLNFDLATDPAAFLQLSYHLMTLCIAFSNSCVITSSSRLPSKMRDMDDGAKETLQKKPNFSQVLHRNGVDTVHQPPTRKLVPGIVPRITNAN